ncbi:GH25 family lysozyme [Streptomyces sp. NPDC001941]|uniref:GH25 family lysozyme n=1 Tax=Streptomyces sp. NPDC001941 TaxID=3154659 RepID=UPI003317530B
MIRMARPVQLLTASALCAAVLVPPAAAAGPPPAPRDPSAPPSVRRLDAVGDAWLGAGVTRREGDRTRAVRPTVAQPPGVGGVDVSSWQGDVDWRGLWKAGKRFAYVKATEATSYRNPWFQRQYDGARAAGMVRGAYHFALPDKSDGRRQADYFVAHGGAAARGTHALPGVLDIEWNPYPDGGPCYGLGPARTVAWIRDFTTRYRERTGRAPVIYTSTAWWQQCTGASTAFGAKHPLWIPSYRTAVGDLPAGWRAHTFWQYTEDGEIVGDHDVFDGTERELRALADGPAPSAGPVDLTGRSRTAAGDFDGDGAVDLTAVDDATGALLRYPGTGTGALAAPGVLGPRGWNAMADVTTAPRADGDGADVLAVRADTGALLRYEGDGAGRLKAGRQLGPRGWQHMREVSAGDFTGDGVGDVVAVQGVTGALLLYRGTAGGRLAAPVTLGSRGWDGLRSLAVGDFDGTGTADVVAIRPATGELLLYRGDGRGGLADATVLGPRGWAGMSGLCAGDFDGDGVADVLAVRTDTGALLRYAGRAGGGKLRAPVRL